MTDYRRLREPTSEALDTECCGQHLGRGKVIGDRLRWPPARPTTRKPNDQRPRRLPQAKQDRAVPYADPPTATRAVVG